MSSESQKAAADDFQTVNRLHYDPSQWSSFSSRSKLNSATVKSDHSKGKIGDRLLQKKAFNLNRPGRKRFPKDPHRVNYLGEL
jgi:hypothetical protein